MVLRVFLLVKFVRMSGRVTDYGTCLGGRQKQHEIGWGHPFASAHRITSRCPPSFAIKNVIVFHGQPFARNHFSTSRCPLTVAHAQVHLFDC